MTVHVNFNIINADFDKEYAKQYNAGRESVGNMKYQRGWSYKINEVQSVELIKNTVHQLQGKLVDGTEFKFSMANAIIFRCHLENGTHLDYAVSASVLNKTQKTPNVKYDIMRCYFYVNAEPASIVLGPSLINKNELPIQLLVSMYGN